MLTFGKYINESLLPTLTDLPPARIDNNGPTFDVGEATFNPPEKALMNSMKTDIKHIKPGSNCMSDDYAQANENNSNGGTPIEAGIMAQFKIPDNMKG